MGIQQIWRDRWGKAKTVGPLGTGFIEEVIRKIRKVDRSEQVDSIPTPDLPIGLGEQWYEQQREKGKEMAKAKKTPVVFSVTDGVKPTRARPSKVFNLRAPYALNIPPRTSVTVKLGLSCNYPLHVFQARSMLEKGLRMPDGIWAAVDAETALQLTLDNTSDSLVLLEQGDVLARAFILDNNDLESEE